MRISDWCSDVCSSDLEALFPRRQDERFDHRLFRLRLRNRASRAMRIVEPADKPSPPSPPRRIRALQNRAGDRSEEQPSELQSLMRTSYAAFCLNKKTTRNHRASRTPSYMQ